MTGNSNMTIETNATEAGGTTQGLKTRTGALKLLSIGALSILVFSVYALGLAAPALLDEQFLLNWLVDITRNHGSSFGFFGWPGFSPSDNWGPLTHGVLLAVGTVLGKNIVLWRIVGVALHLTATLLVLGFSRRLGLSAACAIATAAIFAVYPLSAQAVSWLGGFGSLLGTNLLLGSLWLYVSARSKGFNWPKMLGSLALYAGALAATVNFWYAPFLLVTFELARAFGQGIGKDDSNDSPTQNKAMALSSALVGLALFIGTTGAFLAASGNFEMPNVRTFTTITDLFRDIFMPINQGMWNKYTKEYRIFYFLLPVFGVAAALSFWRSPRLGGVMVMAFSWIFATMLTALGFACVGSFLVGCHMMYFAAVPFALLFACAAFGAAESLKRLRIPAIAGSAVLCLILSIVLIRHVIDTTANYRNWGRILKAVQKSIKTAQAKENASYFILRDLPDHLSVSPLFSQAGPRAFDTQTGMLRSNSVPDGQLLTLLRENKIQNRALRWEGNMKSLIPLDLAPVANTWPTETKAQDVAWRLQPGLPFYKNITMDEKEQVLIMQSNSENGPMITMAANELSPLNIDYMYVDAMIKAPPTNVVPTIELHWQTNVHEDFDRKQRFSYTHAIVNDNQYHRYFLPLRSTGWTTGGRPKAIAMGFPAGSTVNLKSIGVVERSNEIAKITPLAPSAATKPLSFTPPYFNYPTDLELGLIALPPATPMQGTWSVTHIPEAAGVLVEVSKPNANFDDANSNHQSSVTYRTYTLKGTEGQFQIPTADLMGAGVYSVRVIATSANGSYKGMFSDPICYQVP